MPGRLKVLLLISSLLLVSSSEVYAGLAVSPPSVILSAGQSKLFNVQIPAGADGVIWSLSRPIGTITTTGAYIAPKLVPTPQTVVVMAVAGAGQVGSAVISLMPGVASLATQSTPVQGSVSITPASASLFAGQGALFSANVTGEANSAVSWSVFPPIGTVTNGYYQAPKTISVAQVVTIWAMSLADPTVRARAAILLNATPSNASVSNNSKVAPISIQLTPGSVSLHPGQSNQFSFTVGGSAAAATWSLVPNLGTVVNGYYTAPSSVNTTTSVTLIATSTTNTSQTASAAISLQPNALPSVALSVSPSSASLTSGQSVQFGASVTGSTNTAVTWSVSPAVGSLSNGLYRAPASVTMQQALTIKATSVADPTKSASATVTLTPVAISLRPGSISLNAGGSAQFTATVTGTSNTGVTWSLVPAVGSVSNGLYRAPASITSNQTVVIRATSVVDPTKTGQAAIALTASGGSLSVSPGAVSLGASQSQQFSALSSGGLGGAGSVSANWSISPAVGQITQTGLFTAPASISIQQNIIVTATGATGTASATVTLKPPSPAPAQAQSSSSTVVLPLEVMGPAGTQVPVTVNVPSGSNLGGQLQLWMQIHGLKYETEASVQVNGGAWIPINTSTVTIQGYAAKLGGIGGGFATLKLTLNLPAGSVVPGANTLNFQFNGTDGVTSGYRVLNFNILAADGTQLLSPGAFGQDDPATWQPPLNDPADIQAGQTLYKTANLQSASGTPIQAKCADCHTQDGSDLKYFNYSSHSIRVRSMFHGLTQQQGDQIASYIRSLNVPAPSNARPWNPPYQPGPGLDSQPAQNWAAGAGLDAVLDHDSDMLPYLMPGGSTANLEWNSYLNARETPLALQLPDWNRWLPTIHPTDSYGTAFTNGPAMTLYRDMRSKLRPNDAASYRSVAVCQPSCVPEVLTWLDAVKALAQPTPPYSSLLWSDPDTARRIYSDRQWAMVKLWELNHEFGLEGMARSIYGPQAPDRGWVSNQAFYTSPNASRIPPGPGIGNGTVVAHTYLSFIWYQMQLILNDGNGQAAGTYPIDWGYAIAYPTNGLTWDSSQSVVRVGTAGLVMEWLAKGLQASATFGVTPATTIEASAQNTQPYYLVTFPASPSSWSEISPAQRVQLMNTWVSVWFNRLKLYTPQQLFTAAIGISPIANSILDLRPIGSFTGDLAYALPALRYEGVDPNLLSQVATWASGFWPTFDWLGDINKSCSAAPNIVCR